MNRAAFIAAFFIELAIVLEAFLTAIGAVVPALKTSIQNHAAIKVVIGKENVARVGIEFPYHTIAIKIIG